MFLDSRQPQRGPLIMSIAGVTGVQVNAATTGSVVKFRWPRGYKLASWIFFPRSGLPAHAQGLLLRMQDHLGNELVTDVASRATTSAFAPSLALVGGVTPIFKLTGWNWVPSWQALERVVMPGDQWLFQVINSGGAAVKPELQFMLEEVA